MADIQRRVIKQNGRNPVSRIFHSKNDKETITAWRLDLNRILHVFNVSSFYFVLLSLIMSPQTELAVNTHVTVSEMRHDVSKIRRDVSEIRGELGGQVRSVSKDHIQSIRGGRMLIVS